ncbi:MAG: SpoIVB peptidase [bacterium]|nr:SpoIVB peptidase [bacterium]
MIEIMEEKWSGMMKRKVVYKSCLIFAFVLCFCGLVYVSYSYIDNQVPNIIHLVVGEEEQFDFSLPIEADLVKEDLSVINVNQGNKVNAENIHFNFSEPFTMESANLGEYKIALKLFGLINFKTITVNVINETEVIPSGASIGVYIEADGVMVLGTSPITGQDGQNYEPALNVLKSGDYIIAINGQKVEYKEELINKIQENREDKLTFDVRRDRETIKVSLNAVKSADGDYKIGTWIRDNTQGIGTLTYVGLNGSFGALGHGITDVDTNLLMEIDKGTLYNAKVLDIVRGQNGTPGEIVGMIKTGNGNNIGEIYKNTNQGIFGTINNTNYNISNKKAIPIGLKQEIKLGKATILCSVEGEIKEYEIEIEKIQMNNKKQNKGLVIKITDDRLLNITNGIVQGMSGSPILQNGKVIGAVTHVFIQDSTRGYGTFIENMLNSAQ